MLQTFNINQDNWVYGKRQIQKLKYAIAHNQNLQTGVLIVSTKVYNTNSFLLARVKCWGKT